MKTFLVLSGLIAGLASASAADLFYVANIDAAQEAFHNDDPQGVAPDRSGSGTGNFTLSDTGIFSYTISYSGLSAGGSGSTAAHIHGPGQPGFDAPVLFPLQGGTFGTRAGTFAGSVSTPLTPAQISQLNNGDWYVNIHSQNFGVGEIRGQIVAVPEPGTVALLAAAGALMLAGVRSRRNP
jgi:hypothetical protein